MYTVLTQPHGLKNPRGKRHDDVAVERPGRRAAANGSTVMSLINPAILWGFALVSLPIILHFLMRSRPKKYLFPAVAADPGAATHNIRRLRMKHFWLLLLRMAVLAALVIAIARPTLPAANYNPSTSESLTTAGIIAVAIAAYFWLARSWRQQQLPNHVYSYRRTMLRAATGAGVFAAFLLLVILPYQHRISAEISAPHPRSPRTCRSRPCFCSTAA